MSKKKKSKISNDVKKSLNSNVEKKLKANKPQEDKPIQFESVIPFEEKEVKVNVLQKEMMPATLSKFVFDTAYGADCMPPDFIATSLLIALGTVIGAKLEMRPKQNATFGVIPNIWGVIIAEPSQKKSFGINAGMYFLKQIQEQEFERYKKELQDSDNEEITPPRYLYLNDSTPEALAEKQKNNPYGLAMVRDELMGLLVSLEKNEGEGRAYFLEGWNGNSSYTFSRIGRGDGYIKNHCLSVLGAIQPGKLNAYMKEKATATKNDGFLQRFQVMVYPEPSIGKFTDIAPDIENRNAVKNIFERLYFLSDEDISEIATEVDPETKRGILRFDIEAQEKYIAWFNSMSEKKSNEQNSLLVEHLGKYEKLLLAIVLIFHLVRLIETKENKSKAITSDELNLGLKWLVYLESHARKVYGLLESNPRNQAYELGSKLKILEPNDSMRTSGFTVRDIVRKEWKGFKESQIIVSSLEYLIRHRWLVKENVPSTDKGGRPTIKYYINTEIYNK